MSAAEDLLRPGHHGPAAAEPLRLARQPMACVQLLARRAAPPALALPPMGEALETPAYTALATGPGAWLLLAPDPGLMDRLAATAGPVSLIDQSHGRAAFGLAGPAARAALSRLCRLDLDPRVFPPGRVAATLLGPLHGVLHHHREGYTLLVAASYAASFALLLAEAALPFGYDIPQSPA